NYPAFAADGTLYLSDSGHWGWNDGRVYRLTAAGELELFSERLTHFPNGCAVTPDGRHLWMVESYVPTVNRFDLETGELEEVCRLDGTEPDVIAFTDAGSLILARYRLDRLVHIGSLGAVDVIAEDPRVTTSAAP